MCMLIGAGSFPCRMSLGTGRPIVLRDENSIRHCRLLLTHPMASPTDVRLVAQVELIAQKSEFYLPFGYLFCQLMGWMLQRKSTRAWLL